jgi:hypothetical protein
MDRKIGNSLSVRTKETRIKQSLRTEITENSTTLTKITNIKEIEKSVIPTINNRQGNWKLAGYFRFLFMIVLEFIGKKFFGV